LLSRRHAEIVASPYGVTIRDLNSRNGVLVNGEKTRERTLVSGDLVQMGHLQLRYLDDAAHQVPPSAPAQPWDIDRFRPEAAPPPAPVSLTPKPGRWKPEPTPLPGRRSSAPPPPPRPSHAPRTFTPVPRGRAAFEPPYAAPTTEASEPTTVTSPRQTTLGMPAMPDQTFSAEPPRRQDPSGINAWTRSTDADATLLADDMAETEELPVMPGDSTFAAALSHLAGIADQGRDIPVLPHTGACTLVANAELTITQASAECAELLGVPDEPLIGDSLTDVFVRGVRRAYADPGAALTLRVGRGPRGSITVTLTLDRTSGNE